MVNDLLFKVALVVVCIGALHRGFGALGYDLCSGMHYRFNQIIDILVAVAGVVALVAYFTMQCC